MRLIKRERQHRRDFTGTFRCEHCGHDEVKQGYDDAHFHENVIPAMKCEVCGKKSTLNIPTSAPIVPAHVTI